MAFWLGGSAGKTESKSATFADTTYQYTVLQEKITDLDKDILNQILIKTDHCYIRFDRKFSADLAELIATTTREYLRVASDLQFDPESRLPGVAIMSFSAYREVTPDGSGGFFPGTRGKYADFAYINGDQWPPGTDKLGQIIAHELTHWICFQLRGRKSPEKIRNLRAHQHSLRAFEEALAQWEDGRTVELKERLGRQFHSDGFLTIAQIDSSYDPAVELGATTEFQILIPLLASHNGTNELPAIVKRLGNQPLEDALRATLGSDFEVIEKAWFDKMHEIVSAP